MENRAAIRNQGRRAEERFIRLVNGACRSDSSKRGDAIVVVDNREEYIEIKECHAGPRAGGTINQIRAIKYICCVIWAPERSCWYVVSPDRLVYLAASKPRGQHTEIPFECMNFSLDYLEKRPELHERCTDDGLCETVIRAIRSGRENIELSSMMSCLLEEIESLKTKYKELLEARSKDFE